MKRVLFIIVLCTSALCPAAAQTPKPLRIAVIGPSPLNTWFINDLKTAQAEAGLSIEFVEQTDARLDYVVLVHGMSVKAGIVIAFNPKGEIVTSVLRAGPIAAKGVMEADAVDLAKQLAALTKR